MTTQTEALSIVDTMKLALEALTIQSDRVTEIGKKREAITAIKEALANHIEDNLTMVAQPEQEPIGINGLTEAETNATASVFGLVSATPPQPSATARDSSATPLTWIGLDNDDLVWIYSNSDKVGQAISNTEAKLKEKNT